MIIVATIDKDNDFGRKTSLECPIIGEDNVKNAIFEFGLNDPEDSDLNAAFMALKIAREKDHIPAIICGKGKFSNGNYEEIKHQLQIVISKTKTDRIILVTDGAEDDTVIPIISTIANIVDVYHVAVKQLPGMEKTWYIITGYVREWLSNKKVKVFVDSIFSTIFILYGLLLIFSLKYPKLPHYFSTLFYSTLLIIFGVFFLKELLEILEVKISFRKTVRYFEYFLVATAGMASIGIIFDLEKFSDSLNQSFFVHTLVASLAVLTIFIVIERYLFPKEA